MPSNALKRHLPPVSSWRNSRHLAKKARTNSYSTAQQERLWSNDAVDPVVLGPGLSKGNRDASSRRPANEALSQSSKKPSSKIESNPLANGAKLLSSTPTSKSARALKRSASRRKTPGERTEPRGSESDLKDVSYIRRNHKIPTAADYPGAPKTLAEKPKSALLNGSKGRLKTRSSFLQLPRKIACTLISLIPERKQLTTVGEGLTKVCGVDVR